MNQKNRGGKMEIILAEEPFYSIQGEGSTVGKPSWFIRFMGCNLSCTWCDSKFTWLTNSDNLYNYTSSSLAKTIVNHKIKNVIFTGGEPLIFQTKLFDIINSILTRQATKKLRYTYEIETNCSIRLKHNVAQSICSLLRKNLIDMTINMSPKLQFWNKTKKGFEHNLRIFDMYKIPYILKFVYDVEDVKNNSIIIDIVEKYGIDKSKVYVMPEGESREKQLERQEDVLKFCYEYNFNYSPRLHVLMWNTKQGV